MYDFIRTRSEWMRNLPARTALRLSNWPRIRSTLGTAHHGALQRHRDRLPHLRAEDQHLVDTLQRDGIAITSIDALALEEGDVFLRNAAALADAFTAEAHAQHLAGKSFIIVPPDRVVADSDIFGWGLQDRLLDIVESYIGLPPAYDGVAINYTVADGREVSTRKWHRDWEDRRMLKVAVYLHDVDEAGGPFEVIRRPDIAQDDRTGYSYDLADEASLRTMLGSAYDADVVSCVGARGTIVFADTARLYHRGKPAIARDRKALFYSYFSQRPRHPFFCERTGIRRQDMERLARTLPPRQRDAVNWRRGLPLPMRMIPPASL